MNYPSYEIILSSGGIKGISHVGALESFFQYIPSLHIKYYTGCSIGALICLLLTIGYTIHEIKEICFFIEFEQFQDCKMKHFFENAGLDEGYMYTNLFKAMMLYKKYPDTLTFQQLYAQTDIVLTFVTTNITKGIPEYHNYIVTPHLNVLLSLRMSTNIPFIFTPILYNHQFYVDGALLDPFPYFYHKTDPKYKYGIWIKDSPEYIVTILNSFQYMYNIVKIIYQNYIEEKYKKRLPNVMYINVQLKKKDIDVFQLSLTDKIKIFTIGKKVCHSFFHKIYKKKKRKRLLSTYFYRWKYI